MRVVKGSLTRVLEVIELLAAEAGWMRLSDVAQRLDLPNGPTHRLLSYLSEHGWVTQSPGTGQYRLSLKLPLLGQQYLHNSGLHDPIQPLLDDTSGRCKELVRLTVKQGDELSWLASSQGAPPGLMYQPEMRGPVVLHVTANGKAWLATMSNEDAVELALKGGLGKPGAYGPTAVTTIEGLLKELDATRKRGYGLAVEEAEVGVVALAVPVKYARTNEVVGTISIAGPAQRMTSERLGEFHQLLARAAERLGIVWPRHDAAS